MQLVRRRSGRRPLICGEFGGDSPDFFGVVATVENEETIVVFAMSEWDDGRLLVVKGLEMI